MSLSFEDCDAFLASLNEDNDSNVNSATSEELFSSYSNDSNNSSSMSNQKNSSVGDSNNYSINNFNNNNNNLSFGAVGMNLSNSNSNLLAFQNFINNSGSSPKFEDLNNINLGDSNAAEPYTDHLSPDSFSSNVSSSPESHEQPLYRFNNEVNEQSQYSNNNTKTNINTRTKTNNSNSSSGPQQIKSRAQELEAINRLLHKDVNFNPSSIKLESSSAPASKTSFGLNGNNNMNAASNNIGSRFNKPLIAAKPVKSASRNVAIMIKPNTSSHNATSHASKTAIISTMTGSNGSLHNSSKIIKPKKEKSSHNMIEKRYRTNINDKIQILRDCVPSLKILCMEDGEDSVALDGLQPAKKLNKATILSKATEYIKHLELKNEQLYQENRQLRAAVSPNCQNGDGNHIDDSMSHQSSILSTMSSPIQSASIHTDSTSSYSNVSTLNNNNNNNNNHNHNDSRNKSSRNGSSIGQKVLLGSLACVVGTGAVNDFGANDVDAKSLMSMPMIIYNNQGSIGFSGGLITIVGKICLIFACVCYIINIDFEWLKKLIGGELFVSLLSSNQKQQLLVGVGNTNFEFWRHGYQSLRKIVILLCLPNCDNSDIYDETFTRLNDNLMGNFINNFDFNDKQTALAFTLFDSMCVFPNKKIGSERNATAQFYKALLIEVLKSKSGYIVQKLGDWLAKYYYNSCKHYISENVSNQANIQKVLKYDFDDNLYIERLHEVIYNGKNKLDENSGSTAIDLIGCWRSRQILNDALLLYLDTMFAQALYFNCGGGCLDCHKEGCENDIDASSNLQCLENLVTEAKSIATNESMEYLCLNLVSTLVTPSKDAIQDSIELLRLFSEYEDSICIDGIINVNFSLLLAALLIKYNAVSTTTTITTNSSSVAIRILELLSKLDNISFEKFDPSKLSLLGFTALSTILVQVIRFIIINNAQLTLTMEAELLTRLENFSAICRVWVGSLQGSMLIKSLSLRELLVQQFVNLNAEINERLCDIDLQDGDYLDSNGSDTSVPGVDSEDAEDDDDDNDDDDDDDGCELEDYQYKNDIRYTLTPILAV